MNPNPNGVEYDGIQRLTLHHKRLELPSIHFPLSLQREVTPDTIRPVEIYELVWPENRIAHIAAHNVTPEEVEEVCFSRPLVQGTKSSGKNPVFYVLGQTFAGRYLFCVIISFPDGRGYPITARPMTQKEKRRFTHWKGQ